MSFLSAQNAHLWNPTCPGNNRTLELIKTKTYIRLSYAEIKGVISSVAGSALALLIMFYGCRRARSGHERPNIFRGQADRRKQAHIARAIGTSTLHHQSAQIIWLFLICSLVRKPDHPKP